MSILDRAIVRAFEHRASRVTDSFLKEEGRGTHRRDACEPAEFSEPVERIPEQEQHVQVGAGSPGSPPPLSAKPRIERLTWGWPRIVQQLLHQAEYGFLHLAQQLRSSSATQRKKVIGFVSSAQGDGCTSVVLTIARILSREKDLRTLIVEANGGHPAHLELLQTRGDCVGELQASSHRLSTPERPWRLSENLYLMPTLLQDSIIHSDSSRSEWEESLHLRMGEWRNEFDLILMDVGPVVQGEVVGCLWWHDVADRVITIASSNRLAANPLGFVDDSVWEAAGIEPLGVIETFA